MLNKLIKFKLLYSCQALLKECIRNPQFRPNLLTCLKRLKNVLNYFICFNLLIKYYK
jgi:hypothetical protein